MADEKGNIKSEVVVQVSADTSEFDDSIKKSEETATKSFQNIEKQVKQTTNNLKNVSKNGLLTDMKVIDPEQLKSAMGWLSNFDADIKDIISHINESSRKLLEGDKKSQTKDSIKSKITQWKTVYEQFYSSLSSMTGSLPNGDILTSHIEKSMATLENSFATTSRTSNGLVSFFKTLQKTLSGTADEIDSIAVGCNQLVDALSKVEDKVDIKLPKFDHSNLETSVESLSQFDSEIGQIVSSINEKTTELMNGDIKPQKDAIIEHMSEFKSYLSEFYSDMNSMVGSDSNATALSENISKSMRSIEDSFASTPRTEKGIVSFHKSLRKTLTSTSQVVNKTVGDMNRLKQAMEQVEEIVEPKVEPKLPEFDHSNLKLSLSTLEQYSDEMREITSRIIEESNRLMDTDEKPKKDFVTKEMYQWKADIQKFYSDMKAMADSNEGATSISDSIDKTMSSLEDSFSKAPRSLSGMISWLDKVKKEFKNTREALKPYIDSENIKIERPEDTIYEDEREKPPRIVKNSYESLNEYKKSLANAQKQYANEGVQAQVAGAEKIKNAHVQAVNESKKAYQGLKQSITSVGQNLSGIMEDVSNKSTSIGRVIEMQKEAMRSVVNTKFNTEEYDYALERYEKESALLDKLAEKKKRMKASGTKGDSTAMRGLIYDIEEAEKRLAMAKQDIADIKSSNYMYMDSTDTDQYKELSKQLNVYRDLQNNMEHIKSNMDFNNSMADGQSVPDIKDIPKELAKANKEASMLRNTINLLKFPNMRKHMGYFSQEAEEARVQIEELEAELRELGSQRFKTDDFKKLESDITKAYSKLNELVAKLEKAQSLGTPANSSSMKSLVYDIQTVQNNLRGLLDTQAQLLSAPKGAYVPGTDTQQYANMQENLVQLKAGLAEIEAEGQTVARVVAKNIGTHLKNALGTGVTSGVKVAKAGITNLINTVKAAKKHFSNFGKSLKSFTCSDAFLGSPMSPKGVFVFSQMWLQFSMISAIFGEVKRSIDNFAKSFEPFNDALSRTINSLRVFGAQITATFEPLVVVAVPYVEKLLDVLTKTADTLAQFTARLTGNQMYTKASKGNYNYAESLDKTSSGAKKATKAVKEYQNTVLGFDQLNKLNGVDDEDAEIGVDEAKLNKAQTQSTRLNKIADAIHKALSKKDYKGAGKAVADGVNEAFSWIKNVAGWEANSKRVTGALRHVIDFVNSLADEFKGTKAGQAIGDVANTVIESLKLLTEPTKGINFGLIGTRLGQMIKGAIDTVHWDSLGVSIVQSIQGMLAFVNGIISVPDFWVSIGTAIANGIQGMIKAYDPSKVADLVVNFVNGIAELLVTAFGGENAGIGAEIGAKLAETVNKVFAGLSPEQIANGINAFVNTLTSAINTFIKNVDWSTVFSTIGTALKELDWLGIIEIIALFAIPKIPGIVLPLLAPVGTALMSGIGKLFSGGGLSKALSGIGTSIATFFTTGKGASILSGLGTLLASAKGLILKGLTALGSAIAAHPFIAIIIAVVVGLVTFVITHWEEVKTFFINTWNKICEIAGVVGDKLKEIWGNITTWFSDIKTKAGDVVDNVGKWFSDLPNKISEGIHGIFDTVTGWFSDLKTDAEGVVSDIVSFFTSLPDKISAGWGKAKTWVSEHLPFGKEKISVSSVSAYNIPKLAGGGVVGDGQLFIANENGPELVGQHNGQTAVMNNMQIVTAVTRGVRDAMAEVLMTFSHNGGDGDGGDVVIMVDSEELARATLRGQRKLDKRNNPSVSFA